MKIKIVIPYFGRFPNYFEFFLKSCEANDEIKFLVFTDQSVFPEHPSNVSFHVMSFDAFKGIVQKNLSLSSQCVQVLTPSDSTIFKGVELLDDSVVASHAIVTKSFHKKNVLIGGFPASIIKENINWRF